MFATIQNTNTTEQYGFINRFFFYFIFAADSDSTEQGTTQDILTCGSCQKTFALADIVKFIQHKVLQCNKENYGQCFPQGEFLSMHFSVYNQEKVEQFL